MKYYIVSLVLIHFLIHFTYMYCDLNMETWEGTMFYSNEGEVSYQDFFSFYFFGLDGIVLSLILFASNTNLWINRQLVKITAGDLMIRGLIYAMHYLKIYSVSSKERIYALLVYSLLVTGLIMISGRKYGYFKD